MTERVVAWILVAIQFVIFVIVVLVPDADDWENVAGPAALVVVLGAGLGFWAIAVFGRGVTPSPIPSENASLVTRGPYRWIRHPMYTAVTVVALGIVLRSRNAIGLVIVAVLALFFMVKARWEERRLLEAYAGYAEYAEEVGRFVPGIGRLRSPD